MNGKTQLTPAILEFYVNQSIPWVYIKIQAGGRVKVGTKGIERVLNFYEEMKIRAT